ncbi:Alpha/Beta hydrolase protein [Phlyctochytrium arcticum]|nr:Alpha/Beta hydrolase protein [Phlyctochytrium arcticum]
MTDREFTTASGLKLAAKEWGNSDGFPILALHGWLDNANTWDLIAPLLLKHSSYHIISLDMAGHGRSQPRHAQADYVFYKHIDDALDVVTRSLRWSRFGLLGHSMGGGVVTMMAAVIRTQIAFLICVEALGPFTRGPEHYARGLVTFLTNGKQLASSRRRVYASVEDAAQQRATASSGMPLSLQAARTLAERGTESVEGGGVVWVSDPRLRLPHPVHWSEDVMLVMMERITCPVLVIRGDEGFSFDGFNFDDRVKRVKDITVVKLTGKHHLHMEEEHAESCANTMIGWIKSHHVPATARKARGAPEPQTAPIRRYKL